MSDSRCVIGIDVGTGSVRAAVFDVDGRRRSMATEEIRIWRSHGDWAEQSSADIWDAVGRAVRRAVSESGTSPDDVVGIGFDATCSLVVLDKSDQPLTVSDTTDNTRNVILWMDHRAVDETEEINAGGYDVLQYVGGRFSPEMETPKLLWLKRHLPSTWAAAGKFLDLADYLAYQSTGSDVRSLCTVVCKWTYLGHEGRWDTEYFNRIGISDVFDGRVGVDVRPVGSPAGNLTAAAAKHLGLTTSAQVAVGIIDAHAGGIGLLGATSGDIGNALALIGGTSSCHMAVSREPRFIPGIWGPYYSAMIPGMWLTEGGQSATGALIDYAIDSHPASALLQEDAARQGKTVYEVLNDHLIAMAVDAGLPSGGAGGGEGSLPSPERGTSGTGRGAGGEGGVPVSALARHLHLLDYHIGNRSPIADPRARGMVDGLTLDTSRDALALQYLATIQAVAYGTRAIIDAMNVSGYAIDEVHVVGGGTKNELWLQEHADVLGMPLTLPEEPESVLLGSAILAAAGAGVYPDVLDAMRSMCRSGRTVQPNVDMAGFHSAKYGCYRELYDQQVARRARMECAM